MNRLLLIPFIFLSFSLFAQDDIYPSETQPLKVVLNKDGSQWFRVTFLNQTWLRFDQSNPGTTVNGVPRDQTVDIGLRRTRIQMFGHLTERAFLYFQFGQNNFSASYNAFTNRKTAAVFFHDALCEYRITQGNELKLGGGLTVANGLSRFTQPSIGTILTMDVPVFAQVTGEQVDQFNRKLSVYARGQLGKLDYRLTFTDPFPITSSGRGTINISENSFWSPQSDNFQYQAYLSYNFFEMENHTTPYMVGTYLGKKKVFNLSAGIIYQPQALWSQSGSDTLHHDFLAWAVEVFYDAPLRKGKGDAISAYLGYFNTDYGPNFLLYNGLMNPATGSNADPNTTVVAPIATRGNAMPMFGTGSVVYTQFGYLLADANRKGPCWQPYVSATYADYERLQSQNHLFLNAGINLLLKGHSVKFSLDYQNRPTFLLNGAGEVEQGDRKNALILQFQLGF